ncbi:CoA-acylating methylmalonate-semialdehyde dehydrogenase [Microbulbifer sp. OS29]|uniref:methylmalonate-semialdehyde dehydrogenase (CoA acylating) n=1 Tax=Microbulbifer okhotskensis TaxID=2926617 RepID=A0A9X2ET19_9GAMM|nr:CoA-acylating methylmalonate-semialdehyde dehydrogenase [Microbulbifer okhotskensis]MCO1335243.1 CoA-acylating methylmalonate-semialdehyde dehydrogenase [Microbulbifer okhotskensis]
MKIIGHLINGTLVSESSTSGNSRVQEVTNPSTNQVTAKVSLAAKATVEEAIAAAEAAFPAWRNLATAKRVRIMYRLRDLLQENAAKICELITLEHGKVLGDAMGELQRGIENIEYVCSTPEMLKGEHSKNVGPSIDSWSEFQPLGVCAGITPFNFPAMVPLWMWPMAIACGNTFVLKPSERTPSSALLIAELGIEAGIPAGVLNVVNGGKEAVDTLLTDKRIQAVSFVGSTPIAEYVYTTGTAHGKRVQAFGGAKNHAIVMPDADLDNAAAALMGAAYGSCGERCMAISVAVAVGNDTADTLIEKLKVQIAELRVGDGMDGRSDMGPLVTPQHLEKVESYIAAGINEGAELAVDGRNHKVSGYEKGNYLGACLFDRVTPEMSIHSGEIFGPVLCIMRVETMQEAMDIIDAHEYGNGTCLFTRDGEAARYFSDNIKVGMVGINVPLPVPVAHHSFGGWKRSLFGDLHAYGPDSVRFYTKRKTITQRWPASGVREGIQFSFPSNQ